MSNPAQKIIFLGTPEFAVPILEKLINSDFKTAAVFCAPDMPIGRQQILTAPPIKIIAQQHNIPIYQPKDKIELSSMLSALSPTLIISAAYGLILPKGVLDAPQHGCLNVHPSLLPKYRGASPIQAAILNGDTATGVTIYQMDEQIDHGAIIASRQSLIANRKITTPELSLELARLGADLLLEILPDWLADQITPLPQDESQATFTKIIAKDDGRINWQKSAQEIERQIRAYTPWPGAFTSLADTKLKILEAETTEKSYDKKTGEIFLTATDNFAIQAGDSTLIVKKLQLEGGKPLSVQEFLHGHKDTIGQVLK